MTRTCVLIALAVEVCLSQRVEVREEKLHGRSAWVLDNGMIRVSLLRGGGHIGEVRFSSGDAKRTVNPMRVPHYAMIEPYDYDDARHNAIYGDTPHRRLHSGYMGHLLCFPFYGPVSSEDEAKAGLGNHGEAPVVEWKQLGLDRGAGAVTLRYGAELPRTRFRVERAVTLRAGSRQVKVVEQVENLAGWDRPVNWMQHATFGPPFVEPGKTFLDVSATRGLVSGGRAEGRSLRPGAEVKWPDAVAPDGAVVSMRPMQAAAKTGTYTALLLDPERKQQFFTLYHTGYRELIGYVFPATGGPWIADWQENRSNPSPPWNGQTVARGIEWGTTPFAEGLRKSIERGSLFGAPAYLWIGAGRKASTEFTIFLEEIPENYPGVSDVIEEAGAVKVKAR